MNDEIEVTPRTDEELRRAAISRIKRKREFAEDQVSREMDRLRRR